MIRKILNKVRYSKGGLTLIEVLITVLILEVALIGIIGTFTKITIFTEELREHNVVRNALNERLEEVRAMDFDNILSLGTSFTASGFSELNSVTGTMAIEDVFSDANIRRVSAIVTWTSPQGRQMTKSLATLITRDGINKQ